MRNSGINDTSAASTATMDDIIRVLEREEIGLIRRGTAIMAACHTTLPTIPKAVSDLSTVDLLPVTSGIFIRIFCVLILVRILVFTLIAKALISLVHRKSLSNLVLEYIINSVCSSGSTSSKIISRDISKDGNCIVENKLVTIVVVDTMLLISFSGFHEDGALVSSLLFEGISLNKSSYVYSLLARNSTRSCGSCSSVLCAMIIFICSSILSKIS